MVSVRRNPPHGKGVPHSADYAAPKRKRHIKPANVARLIRPTALVDIKLGKLNHQDVGQIDTYVRIYDQHYKGDDDNPTIGLILCSEKSQAVAKYSVLTDSRQRFASKYLPYLPTEEELRLELQRERRLLNEEGSV